jgi:hypothetical protein
MTTDPSDNGCAECASPFRKVGSPMTTARSFACSAPDSASAALADPVFTSTASGRSVSAGSEVRSRSVSVRPGRLAMGRSGPRNISASATSSSTAPPPSFRRSSSHASTPSSISRSSSRRTAVETPGTNRTKST